MAKISRGAVPLLLGALLAAAAVLLLLGLGNAYLWEDEASTASFGENVLKCGVPTAWDGVNLLAHHGGLMRLWRLKPGWRHTVTIGLDARNLTLLGTARIPRRKGYRATLLPSKHLRQQFVVKCLLKPNDR